MITYRFVDIDINIKAIISYNGTDVFAFNCHTKYEDRADEVIDEVMNEVNKLLFEDRISVKEAFERTCKKLNHSIEDLNTILEDEE